ncbi:MAG: PTS sugar transporter subunit IIA [Candidatus Cloacimonetes bacterium]|nr:PTS sugar transporter subunit IIA [Candidatus Cloacimonadota bacterium]
MRLISLLNPKLILFEDKALTKEQIIRRMLDKICEMFELINCTDKLMQKVLERESETATVYPTGMAIPHIRMDGLDDTIIAISIPRHPIKDKDTEVKIYILILTDKNISSLYLNVVASFMRISKDEALYNSLLNAKDVHSFMNYIEQANIKDKDEVTVSDIMTTEPPVINENETIKALAEMMKEHHLYYIPVVNNNGDWVGDVNLLHYFQVSVPDYMQMMNNVNFLHSFEPFEHLYKQEDNVLVKQVMSKPERLLHPDYTIIEAVFEMVKQKKQTFSVIQDNKVVGIVTAMDIYTKVVRA